MDIKRVISSIEKNYIKSNLKKGNRIDGRGLWEYRDFTIKTDYIASAEGSSDVTLGDSRIISGLKYEIGGPFLDQPDEGVCTIMAELLPLASPLFESGPPDEKSIELARVVDRGIRHADCIQTKKLCIKEGTSVYILFVDMYVINDGGNLIDCGGIGALTTLLSARIPEGRWNEEKNEVEWTGNYITSEKIIKELPFVLTFGKIDDIIFLDPNLPEELVSDGRISISVTEHDNITSIQKSGTATFSIEEIKMLGKKTLEIADEMRGKLNLRQYISSNK